MNCTYCPATLCDVFSYSPIPPTPTPPSTSNSPPLTQFCPHVFDSGKSRTLKPPISLRLEVHWIVANNRMGGYGRCRLGAGRGAALLMFAVQRPTGHQQSCCTTTRLPSSTSLPPGEITTYAMGGMQ